MQLTNLRNLHEVVIKDMNEIYEARREDEKHERVNINKRE